MLETDFLEQSNKGGISVMFIPLLFSIPLMKIYMYNIDDIDKY
jgi:hypothetical protein